MSEKPEPKGKVKLTVGKLLSVGSGADFSKLLPPSIVTPVLRDVGKLAASVAAVNTNANGRAGGGRGNSLTAGCSSGSGLGSGSASASGSGSGSGSGSATGNPRNKCSLEPGHSLMDWIRLGNSGKDLTGVGDQAGKITVSQDELHIHNTREDAWISIRGNVYNVTEYLAFHPGGVEEIMRGVGLPDATALFDEVHPWVNYDKMLTKCYVGRVGSSSSLTNFSDQGNVRFVSPKNSVAEESPKMVRAPDSRQYSITINEDRLVRFDWIQKHDLIVLYFYTGPYSNPFFDIRRPFEDRWTFVITFVESVFTFKFTPHDALLWPPRFKVYYETGKVEVGFEKQTKRIWPACGIMEQSKRKVIPQQCKKKYIIREHIMLNKYTFMVALQKMDLSLCNTPLAYHVLLYNDVNDAREYTPVPHAFIKHDSREIREPFDSPFLTLIIRRYNDGRLSNFLYNKKVGDTVLGTDPIGVFDLLLLADKRYFLLLGGGVGVTPLLGIIHFLLERKVKPVGMVMLVTYNPTQQHLFLHQKFSVMSEDPRFDFISVITQPPPDYNGLSGYMNVKFMRTLLQQGFHAVPLDDIFFLCCGPASFNNCCFEQLSELNVDINNTFFFTSSLPHKVDATKQIESTDTLPLPVAIPPEEETPAPLKMLKRLDHYYSFQDFTTTEFKRRSWSETQNAADVSFVLCCFCIPIPRSCVARLRRTIASIFFGWR